MPPDAPKVLDALGITNLNNVSVITGLDKAGFVSKTTVAFDGSPQGLFQIAGAKPLAASDLASVPADAVSAVVLRLDADALYDAFFKIVEQADPKAKADMLAGIGQMEKQFGLKLREDILQPLGDTISIFNSAKEGGPMGGTAVIALKDPQKAKATHEKLFQILQAKTQGKPAAPAIKKSNLVGKEIYTLKIPGPQMFAPAWCLTDKELIVGMTPEKLQAYLSRPADFKSLGQTPELAKTIEGGSGPLAVVYFDTKQMFDSVYQTLPLLMMMAAPTLQQQGINLNASMLPSPNAIRPHLLPLVATVRKTAVGIEITERSSLPMAVAMSPANPIAIALLLPAVQAAREAARRAQGTNNLKQIGLAMHNYHDARKSFPPAFKADKDGKPLLSWRVLILPYLEEEELYGQFNLDEPWDSAHNKPLIAKMPGVYKSPNSRFSGEGKTNYLTVRGEKTVFSGSKGIRIAEITDGTSNTIMAVEASDEKAVPWTKPDDFEYDEKDPMAGLSGLHASVFLVLFADGSVQAISGSLDADMLKAFFTRNGGEPVNR
jgi:hypothetical protein